MGVNITEKSKTLFIAYFKDAGNWGGTPLVGGNVGGTKEDRGNLTQLKKEGLIYTKIDGDRSDLQWLYFTELGLQYAESIGLEKYF